MAEILRTAVDQSDDRAVPAGGRRWTQLRAVQHQLLPLPDTAGQDTALRVRVVDVPALTNHTVLVHTDIVVI